MSKWWSMDGGHEFSLLQPASLRTRKNLDLYETERLAGPFTGMYRYRKGSNATKNECWAFFFEFSAKFAKNGGFTNQIKDMFVYMMGDRTFSSLDRAIYKWYYYESEHHGMSIIFSSCSTTKLLHRSTSPLSSMISAGAFSKCQLFVLGWHIFCVVCALPKPWRTY